MAGATSTSTKPEVAPAGTVIEIPLSLQELMVAGVPLTTTMLPPCVAPKPEPLMLTCWPMLPVVADNDDCWPMLPVVADNDEITGAGDAGVLSETLSKVAVARLDALPLHTARPISTSWAIAMVTAPPSCVQFTPSGDR